MDQSLKRQLAKIAKSLVKHDNRISIIERTAQAKYVSITDGSTTYYNTDGEPTVVVGRQPDGTYTTVDQNGPVLLAPSAPILTSQPGIVIVAWDGLDEFGSTTWPSHFDHIEVHLSTTPNFTPTDVTELDTFSGIKGGTLTLALTENTYYFKFVAVNTSRVESAPSIEVEGAPLPLIDGIQTYYTDDAPSGLGSEDVGALWFDTNDDNRMHYWDGAVWIDIQPTAIDQAVQDSLNALNEAQERVKFSYATARPTGLTADDRMLWMNPNNGYAAEYWNGSVWSAYFFGSEAVGFDARDIGGILTSVGLSPPSNPQEGDIWYNESEDYRPEVYTGGSWVPVRDGTIEAASIAAAQALSDSSTALSTAQAAQATADGSIRTYYQSNPPWANGSTQPDSVLGDMWFDQDDGNAYRWNGTSWQLIEDSSIAVALAAAQSAQSTADGKINSYYSATAPTVNGEGQTLGVDDAGDLWFETDNGNKANYWTGSAWAALPVGREALTSELVTTLDSKITTYSGASDPGDPARAGDLWLKPETINAVSVNVLYRRNDTDTAWVKVDDPAAQQAISDAAAAAALADGKMKIYPQDSPPTGLTASDNGDLWIDTNDGNKTYRYLHGSTAGTNGSGGAGPWISILDTSLASIQYVDQQILTSANGKNKSTYSTGVPGTTANTAGDIWFQYNGSNQIIGQWRGTGGTSWTPVTIENSVIATLDAGKINTGFLDVANRINAGSLSIGQVANLQTTLNSKVSTFTTTGASPTTPTATAVGDIWIHTNVGITKIYRATATGTANWVIVSDDSALPTTFVQAAIPTSVSAGDVWVDTDDGKMYRAAVAGATTIAAGAWILFNDPATAGNRTFAQTSIPTSTAIGDVWVDTDDSNKIYTAAAAGATTIAAGGWVLRTDLTTKTRTFMQTAVPTSSAVGDAWIDTDDNNKLYVANAAGVSTVVVSGSGWYLVQDAIGAASAARTGAVSDLKTLWGHPTDTTYIDGGDIFTNSIRAKSLLLTDINNYLSDPNVTDLTTNSWSLAGGATMVAGTGTTPGYMIMNTSVINTNLRSGDAAYWATEPGTEYQISGEVAGVATNVGNTTFMPSLETADQSGANTGYPQGTGIVVGTSTAWVPFTFMATIPAGSAKFRWFPYINGTTVSNKVWVRNIKVRRKNSGSLIVDGSIEAGKLGVNSVIAQNIVSGEITGDKIEANALNGKTITGALIRTAAEGRRVELLQSGLVQLDSNNSVILSIGDHNKFTGEINATSMIIQDSLQMFGRNNMMAVGSKLSLVASTSAPSAPPTISWDYEQIPHSVFSHGWFMTGLHTEASPANHSFTELYFNSARIKKSTGEHWEFVQIDPPDSPETTTVAEFKPWTYIRIAKADNNAERAVVMGEDHTHRSNGYPETWIRVYDDSTMNTSGTGAPVLKASFKFSDFSWLRVYKLARLVNGGSYKNRFGVFYSDAPLQGGTRRLQWADYRLENDDSTITQVGAYDFGYVIDADEELSGGVVGTRAELGLDGAATTDTLMIIMTSKHNAVFNLSTLTWETDSYWPTTFNEQSRSWVSGSITANTVAGYNSYNWGAGSNQQFFKYANNHKKTNTISTFWARFVWRGEATKSYLTTMSAPASIAQRKMARLRVSIPALPAPVAGIGQPRDIDADAYGWVYYLGQGGTDPGRTGMYQQAVQPVLSPGVASTENSITLSTYPVFSGSVPPVVSTFPASSAASITSENGLLAITGDGTVTAKTLTVTDPLVVSGLTLGNNGTWSPVFTASSGTISSVSAPYAEWMYIHPKLVYFSIQINIVTVGTATGALFFTLPVAAETGSRFFGGREDAVTGSALQCVNTGGSQVKCLRTDNTSPIIAGTANIISGTYRVA